MFFIEQALASAPQDVQNQYSWVLNIPDNEKQLVSDALERYASYRSQSMPGDLVQLAQASLPQVIDSQRNAGYIRERIAPVMASAPESIDTRPKIMTDGGGVRSPQPINVFTQDDKDLVKEIEPLLRENPDFVGDFNAIFNPANKRYQDMGLSAGEAWYKAYTDTFDSLLKNKKIPEEARYIVEKTKGLVPTAQINSGDYGYNLGVEINKLALDPDSAFDMKTWNDYKTREISRIAEELGMPKYSAYVTDRAVVPAMQMMVKDGYMPSQMYYSYIDEAQETDAQAKAEIAKVREADFNEYKKQLDTFDHKGLWGEYFPNITDSLAKQMSLYAYANTNSRDFVDDPQGRTDNYHMSKWQPEAWKEKLNTQDGLSFFQNELKNKSDMHYANLEYKDRQTTTPGELYDGPDLVKKWSQVYGDRTEISPIQAAYIEKEWNNQDHGYEFNKANLGNIQAGKWDSTGMFTGSMPAIYNYSDDEMLNAFTVDQIKEADWLSDRDKVTLLANKDQGEAQAYVDQWQMDNLNTDERPQELVNTLTDMQELVNSTIEQRDPVGLTDTTGTTAQTVNQQLQDTYSVNTEQPQEQVDFSQTQAEIDAANQAPLPTDTGDQAAQSGVTDAPTEQPLVTDSSDNQTDWANMSEQDIIDMLGWDASMFQGFNINDLYDPRLDDPYTPTTDLSTDPRMNTLGNYQDYLAEDPRYQQEPTNYMQQYFDNDQRLEDFNYETSPGYQFRLDEAQKAIERSAAARGGVLSGRAGKELARYTADYALKDFNMQRGEYDRRRREALAEAALRGSTDDSRRSQAVNEMLSLRSADDMRRQQAISEAFAGEDRYYGNRANALQEFYTQQAIADQRRRDALNEQQQQFNNFMTLAGQGTGAGNYLSNLSSNIANLTGQFNTGLQNAGQAASTMASQAAQSATLGAGAAQGNLQNFLRQVSNNEFQGQFGNILGSKR